MRLIFKITYFLLILSFVISMISCHRISGNQLHFERLSSEFVFVDGKSVFRSFDNTVYEINLDTRQISRTYDFNSDCAEPVMPIISGGTSPKYCLDIAEEYKNIENNLLELVIPGNKNSVIYTQGYLIDGGIYGICNVYKDTVGYFAGGANYGEEEIDHSVYYFYDFVNDSFQILAKIHNSTMVAFSKNKVICWENKKFYSLNTETNERKFICNDYSYDRGLQHQSVGRIFFNEEYALLCFDKAEGLNDKFYSYLFEFGTDTSFELKYIE